MPEHRRRAHAAPSLDLPNVKWAWRRGCSNLRGVPGQEGLVAVCLRLAQLAPFSEGHRSATYIPSGSYSQIEGHSGWTRWPAVCALTALSLTRGRTLGREIFCLTLGLQAVGLRECWHLENRAGGCEPGVCKTSGILESRLCSSLCLSVQSSPQTSFFPESLPPVCTPILPT